MPDLNDILLRKRVERPGLFDIPTAEQFRKYSSLDDILGLIMMGITPLGATGAGGGVVPRTATGRFRYWKRSARGKPIRKGQYPKSLWWKRVSAPSKVKITKVK